MKDLNLTKTSYSKNLFENTIDTNFSQLANTAPSLSNQETPTPDINQFFQDYQTLFYQIPKFGEINSHEYLIKTSSEYIGGLPSDNSALQALIEEINTLRQQNLELQKNQTTQTSQQIESLLGSLRNNEQV